MDKLSGNLDHKIEEIQFQEEKYFYAVLQDYSTARELNGTDFFVLTEHFPLSET